MISIYLLTLFFEFLAFLEDTYFHQGPNQNIYLPNLCSQNTKLNKQYGFIRLLFEYTDIISFAIICIFLYHKSDRDILQGISKLDNIMRVSTI